MKKVVLCFLLLVVFLIPPVTALEINGYYRNEIVAAELRSGRVILGNLNKLRLRMDHSPNENILIRVEPEYIKLISTGTIPLSGTAGLDKVLIDRYFIKLRLPKADVTLGRQRIAWGTAYVWNPTDLVNPFALTLADEERNGVDALRIDIPIDDLSNLDMFYLFNGAYDNTTKGIRIKTNINNYDASLSYMSLPGGLFYGGDFSGELFELGVRGEGAYSPQSSLGRYGKVVLGANYTFENGVGVDGEYFFNSLGRNNKGQYNWANLLAGRISHLARSYLYLSTNKMIDELSSYRIGIIINLNDYSYIFYPNYTYNLSNNLDFTLEALVTDGQSGTEYNPNNTQDPTGFLGLNLFFVKFVFSF